MSTRGGVGGFASKGAFDILGDDVEDVEEEEEEEVQPIADASSAAPTNSNLSKSARKRLARTNAKASSSPANGKSAATTAMDTVKSVVPSREGVEDSAAAAEKQLQDTLDHAKEVVTNVVNGHLNGKATPPINGTVNGAASPQKSEPQPSTDLGKTGSHPERPQPKSIGSSFIAPQAQASSSSGASENGGRKSSFSKPPSTSFAPDLPESLPQPTGNALPANRKRKTPTDFLPTGPKGEGPGSPNKLGVKFEDGVLPGEGNEGETTLPVKVEPKNKNMIERTVMTFVMIGGFIVLLCAGHPFMICLVLLCQSLVYKEVTALFELRDQGAKKTGEGDKWSKTLNWYFFVVTNYFLYGESIIYYFKHIVFVDAIFLPFARNHRFISFMLYTVGFVGFVGNLDKRYLRQQFALFCWVHISLLLIVVSSHFIVNNILEGLVWFFVPASLVICNDVMAYVCGKTFGRTPLIKLSPKKTVEGFVGAFLCTLLFALAWGTFFMRFPYMICPARDLGMNAFSTVVCRPNPVFVWRDFEFSGIARKALETVLGRVPPTIPYAPFQLHCLVMATFASLVAPFGGFFASGFKRAFNIKDFGHSIPGHGGMTDRMDCQFMMGLFAYVYYSSMIRIQDVSVGSIMQTVATSLTTDEQLELLSDLKRFLVGQGVKAGVQ